MCGRYASSRRDAEVAAELGVDAVVGEELPPSWNLAPTQPARIVLEREPADVGGASATRQLRTLRWGLIPPWATDAKIGSRMINARKETVTEKAAFQVPASRRRCLVPADGFFEWERRPDRKGTVPHFLHSRRRLLTFAGLYEFWQNPAVAADDPDHWVASFTILTTQAPDALGHIHDRSPVVVPPGMRGWWLDPRTTELAVVRRLLDAVPETLFETHEVGSDVNDHRNNGPKLVEVVRESHDTQRETAVTER